MPKTISSELENHLQQAVTTLAELWKIVRTDGVTFYYTTHDQDIEVGGQTYLSTSGFSRTTITNHADGQVDSLEVTGFFTASGLQRADIEASRFDFASIYLSLVNWADLTMGSMALRRGYLGEATTSRSGQFSVELRGMTQVLIQEFNNVFQPICRNDLGDSHCQIPIKPAAWIAATAYGPGNYVTPATLSSDESLIALFINDGGTGVSGGTEPSWDFTIGATTVDGSVTWTAVTSLRQIATISSVVDGSTFVPSTFFHPGANLGNTATCTFINNIKSGAVLAACDGINTASYTAPFDMTAGQFAAGFLTNFTTHSAPGTMEMTCSLQGVTLVFTNHSGQQAFLFKSGDAVPGMRISQFQPAYLDGGTIQWVTGQNAGLAQELKTFDFNNNQVDLWLPASYPMSAGDKFIYYAGCDKTRTTCVQKFNNILNMRGEPDMPGINKALGYPVNAQ